MAIWTTLATTIECRLHCKFRCSNHNNNNNTKNQLFLWTIWLKILIKTYLISREARIARTTRTITTTTTTQTLNNYKPFYNRISQVQSLSRIDTPMRLFQIIILWTLPLWIILNLLRSLPLAFALCLDNSLGC